MNLGYGLNIYSEYLEKINYKVFTVDINDVSISKKKVIIYDRKHLPFSINGI